MVCRDDVERGGFLWLKVARVAGQMPKRRKARVLEILGQHTLRIQTLDDEQERIIRYNEADPDEDYIFERNRRAEERRQRVLKEHEERQRNGAPVAPSQSQAPAAPTPAPTPAPARDPLPFQLVPRIVTKIQIPDNVVQLVTRQNQAKKQQAPMPSKKRHGGRQRDNRTTERFAALLRWLLDTVYKGERGSQKKMGEELGMHEKTISALLRQRHGIPLERAIEIAKPIGIDAAYFTQDKFVPPDEWSKQQNKTPAPAAAPAKHHTDEVLSAAQAFAAPKPAPAPAAGALSVTFTAPSASGIAGEVLAPLDRELAALEHQRIDLQTKLEHVVARTTELVQARAAVESAFRGLQAVKSAMKSTS